MKKYNRNENRVNCRHWEGEIPKCENCGAQSELMSVYTQYGWMELCGICYKQMYIPGEQEPYDEESIIDRAEEPSPHRAKDLFPTIFSVRLPDLRKFREIFSNIKTAICGKKKGCELRSKDCPVFCIRSTSLCEDRENYTKKEVNNGE